VNGFGDRAHFNGVADDMLDGGLVGYNKDFSRIKLDEKYHAHTPIKRK
jgi:hypothetical protein